MEYSLTPFTRFLQKVLDEIKEVDTSSVFATPVDISEVHLTLTVSSVLTCLKISSELNFDYSICIVQLFGSFGI